MFIAAGEGRKGGRAVEQSAHLLSVSSLLFSRGKGLAPLFSAWWFPVMDAHNTMMRARALGKTKTDKESR